MVRDVHAMGDAEIIEKLRAERKGRTAVELANLLDELTNGGLSQGSMVTFFKRAYRDIPLGVLLDAGGWMRVSGGGITDEGFNELLGEWLPGSGV